MSNDAAAARLMKSPKASGPSALRWAHHIIEICQDAGLVVIDPDDNDVFDRLTAQLSKHDCPAAWSASSFAAMALDSLTPPPPPKEDPPMSPITATLTARQKVQAAAARHGWQAVPAGPNTVEYRKHRHGYLRVQFTYADRVKAAQGARALKGGTPYWIPSSGKLDAVLEVLRNGRASA